METKTEMKLNVGGMHCDACVRRLSNALGKLPGVEVEQVEVGSARLRYEPGTITPEQITHAVERAGFAPQTQ